MKNILNLFFIFGLLLLSFNCKTEQKGQTDKESDSLKVVTGADVLVSEKIDLVKNKNIGLVVNHTALLSDGRHLVDALNEIEDVNVVALFGPEHGVRGDTTGAIENAVDVKTGIPMYSLYGKTFKPTPEMLKGVDLLVFDIQDVGARFYTFITTLAYVMEAAAENNIPVMILDRPDPITGLYVDGPVRVDSVKSFVGFAPIPIAYGMTIGELAKMYNGEGWLENGEKAELTVVTMKGWTRDLWYDETGLKWIKPSPNMPFVSTAVVYTGTCLFEGTNVTEGRGTERPFEYIGAPWIDSKKVVDELNAINIPGVIFEAIEFTPEWYSFNSTAPKFHNEKCNGIFVNVTDRDSFEAVKAGVYLLWSIRKNHPDNFEWKDARFDRLSGDPQVRKMLSEGKTPEEIFDTWKDELKKFKEKREKYLLY